MASLIEELLNVLEEETGCYQTLLNMADNKKDVIIKGDVPSLQEITNKEQELAGHLLRLERKRKQNLEDICMVLNKRPEELTINRLIEILSGTEKDRLKDVHNRILTVISELKKYNDSNADLIQQSLEYIEFTVNAIQSMSSAEFGNSYAAKGKRYDDMHGKNFFDAKQ